MPPKKQIDLGPIGVTVAANIEWVRKHKNLSYAELSRRLDDLGRPIAPLGLTRIRDLQRRVDIDDLIAIALALGFPPLELLLPLDGSPSEKVKVTDKGSQYSQLQLRNWLMGLRSIDAEPPEVPYGQLHVSIRVPGEPPIELVPANDETLRALVDLDKGRAGGND
jgi:hypothetical protein